MPMQPRSHPVVEWSVLTFRVLLLGVLSIAVALPWGLGDAGTVSLALSLSALLGAWALNARGSVPLVFVFLSGIIVDAATGSPLGYWAFLFLFATGVARQLHTLVDGFGWIGRFLSLGITMSLVGFVAWAVASLFQQNVADLWPFARGTLVAIVAAYPMAYVLDVLEATLIRNPVGALMDEI